jgi:hypothetical protein
MLKYIKHFIKKQFLYFYTWVHSLNKKKIKIFLQELNNSFQKTGEQFFEFLELVLTCSLYNLAEIIYLQSPVAMFILAMSALILNEKLSLVLGAETQGLCADVFINEFSVLLNYYPTARVAIESNGNLMNFLLYVFAVVISLQYFYYAQFMFLEGLCFMAQTRKQVWRNFNNDDRIKAFKHTLLFLRQQGLLFISDLKKRICDLANKSASFKDFKLAFLFVRQQSLLFISDLKKLIDDLANKSASLKSFMDFIGTLRKKVSLKSFMDFIFNLHENVSIKSFMGFLLLNVLILNLLLVKFLFVFKYPYNFVCLGIIILLFGLFIFILSSWGHND